MKHYIQIPMYNQIHDNVHALLYYIHMNAYNQLNYRRLLVPIIHFCILIWVHIWRHFCTSLSVRVFNSGHPVQWAIKYCMKNPCRDIHHYILALSTQHHKLINTHKIQQITYEAFFAPAYHMHQKISYKINLSHFTLLNFGTRLIWFKHRFHWVRSFSYW